MRDNIVLSDGTETIVVNQLSYCELIKWLIVKYTGVSYQEADSCVEQHIPFFEGIDNFLSASLESHSWPYYYTAMDLFFGGHTHAKPVLPPPDTPERLGLYEKIEENILREHNLKEPIIWESN